eukprot:COSAG03_NODE_12086_length_561_cov_2.034632_2_plen_99_part_01
MRKLSVCLFLCLSDSVFVSVSVCGICMYCLEQVVDWCSAPDERIAQVSRLYARPTAVLQTMHPPVEFWLQPDDPDHGIKLCTGGAIAEVLEGGVAAANG